MASAAPSPIEQSPPSTSGNSPPSTMDPMRSASRTVYRAISADWLTPSPGRQSPGSKRGGVWQPASRAPRRVTRPWSRSAPGALAQPGTEVGVGGRSPRLDGASRTAMRGMPSEQRVREGAAGLEHGRVVRRSDGEQRDEVGTDAVAVVPADPADQLDQAGVGLLRLSAENLDIGRTGLRVDV